ncbi:MAG: reductase DrgA [Cellvibrionaceae bacterium]|nr:reductase DrgA [Cellvibrionaceae bacterium]|tara:strand:- start:26378 stop:26980 length:603 start_codon:yes stop_codon:yes gene_type:complete
MDVFNAIRERRSVKHYDVNARLSDQQFQQLISSTLLSPTSYNIQHWRFVRIQDRELREALKTAAWEQSQVTDAAELIVVCADIDAWKDRPERYWADADIDTQNLLVPMIDSFYRGKPQLQRDEAIRSCGIAAQTLMLSAKAMGFDSNPMIGFDAEQVADLIKLPDNHLIAMLIAVGKASKAARPRGGQLAMDDVLFTNGF